MPPAPLREFELCARCNTLFRQGDRHACSPVVQTARDVKVAWYALTALAATLALVPRERVRIKPCHFCGLEVPRSACPDCGKIVCQTCAEQPYESCCDDDSKPARVCWVVKWNGLYRTDGGGWSYEQSEASRFYARWQVPVYLLKRDGARVVRLRARAGRGGKK
jgi:hypothetical protein